MRSDLRTRLTFRRVKLFQSNSGGDDAAFASGDTKSEFSLSSSLNLSAEIPWDQRVSIFVVYVIAVF